MAHTRTEPIELECPNDRCDGIDGEYDNTVPCWTQHRVRWEGTFVYEDDGASGYTDPDTEKCSECGAQGEEVE